MKTKFTLLAVLIATFFGASAQQLQNASFDVWTSPLNPDGWATYGSAFGFNLGLEKRDTVDKIPQLGPSSISIKSDSIPGFPQYGVFPGVVSTGTGTASMGPPSFTGIAFPYRPDTLALVYKYVTPNGTDTALLTIRLRDNNTTLFSGALPLDTTSQWAILKVALTDIYGPTAVPDSLLIQLTSSNRAPKKGSNLHVEGVGFIYAAVTAIAATTDAVNFCQGDSANLTGTVQGGNPAVTYRWLKDGVAVPGATTASYTATASGSYAFEAANGDAVDTSSAITLTVQTCTGIEAVNAATVSVYPNPASNLLNVSATESLSGFVLNVVDVTGRTVSTTVLDGNNNSINVSNLANGSYTYTIGNKANGVIKTNSIQIAK